MDLEQCLAMIKSLSDAYKRIALSTSPPQTELYRLKHLMTEIDLAILSMKKSLKAIEFKVNIKLNATIKPLK